MADDLGTNHGALRTFLLVNGLTQLSSGLLAPLLSVFVVQVGGDLRSAGELASIYLLLATFFGMWVSRQSMERQRLFFLASLTLIVPLNFAFLGVQTHDQLYLLQASLGMVGGMSKPATTYWMARYMDRKESAYLWQRDATVQGALATAASFVGGYMSHHLGFSSVFVAMGTLSLCNLLVAVFVLDKRYFRVTLDAEGDA